MTDAHRNFPIELSHIVNKYRENMGPMDMSVCLACVIGALMSDIESLHDRRDLMVYCHRYILDGMNIEELATT